MMVFLRGPLLVSMQVATIQSMQRQLTPGMVVVENENSMPFGPGRNGTMGENRTASSDAPASWPLAKRSVYAPYSRVLVDRT